MSWVGLREPEDGVYAPAGLGRASRKPVDINSILPRGSLMIECASDPADGTQHLIDYATTTPWDAGLRLTLEPQGRLRLRQWQGESVFEAVLDIGLHNPARVVTVLYTWDAPARQGRLSVDVGDIGLFAHMALVAPLPVSLRDAVWMMADTAKCKMSRGVRFAALADHVATHGPTPSLAPRTPILTPTGHVQANDLRAGQLVCTADGGTAQVRWAGQATLPARGRFAPVTLRAHYHGARHDLTCAAEQRIRLYGTEVEYLFASDCVSVNVGDLTDGILRNPTPRLPTFTYCHFLLDRPVPVMMSGLQLEGLDTSLMQHDPALRLASVLAHVPIEMLPTPPDSDVPVLRGFETLTLCSLRAA